MQYIIIFFTLVTITAFTVHSTFQKYKINPVLKELISENLVWTREHSTYEGISVEIYKITMPKSKKRVSFEIHSQDVFLWISIDDSMFYQPSMDGRLRRQLLQKLHRLI